MIIGTLVPAAVLIALGAYWLFAGRHIAIPFSAGKLEPNLGSISHLVFFVGVRARLRRHRDGRVPRQGDPQPQARLPARDLPRGGTDRGRIDPRHSGDRVHRPQAKLSLVAGIPQAFDLLLQGARRRRLGDQADVAWSASARWR